MKKIDFKKELKNLYSASSKNVCLVEVPKMNYLMIEGIGNPNTSTEYKEAIEALFTLAYAIKFLIRKGELQYDYGVMPLECLWWVDDMNKFDVNKKDDWKWMAMIMHPNMVNKEIVEMGIEQVKRKKNPNALHKIKFDSYHEGKAAQIMHIGPFTEEGPTIQKVHNFIAENNYSIKGKHHEIYLSDIRRASPEIWKTIIRQPID